jgi:starch-binding outer membrane protein, SusD/RagB family
MNKTMRILAVAGALLVGASACTDLTTAPTDRVAGSNIFDDPGSYEAYVAKLYGGLSLTGIQGPAGSGDIDGIDEGFSSYLRQFWQLEELPTDEAVIGWGDQDLPELNTQKWGSSNVFVSAMFARAYYQIVLANVFLQETTDAKLTARGVTPALRTQIAQFRAEARFLRALSYWHALDLFGNVPLVTEEDELGATPPEQVTRQQVYDYVVAELTAIAPELPAIGAAEYGRADRGAVQMLLAKLYLNSAVYTGTARYAEARAAVEAVIASGAYQLDDRWRDPFLADNHTSPEMIFPVPFDGQHTRNWGGMTYLVHAAVGGNMNAGNYGIDGGWWGLRIRPELYNLFGTGDHRADIFFTNGQSVNISSISDFFQGVAAPKFANVTSTGAPGSNPTFPDTDFPMFRLTDAYLMYAEAVVRGGGGSSATALGYVNAIRRRAYGDDSGNITAGQLTLDFILQERARELYWEGHRRTDLVRFGRFTGGSYVWTFKGGVPAGTATDGHLNLYPIPAKELVANPNLSQNAGY